MMMMVGFLGCKFLIDRDRKVGLETGKKAGISASI